MANRPNATWHDMCLYSTARHVSVQYDTTRHEHVSVGHAARHDNHVGWAEFGTIRDEISVG